MTTNLKSKWLRTLLLIVIFSIPTGLFAKGKQEKEKKEETSVAATMKLNFLEKDSVKICKAIISAGERPLQGIQVKFYAKRFFSLLSLIPNGKAVTTDENGEAIVKFPKELPGDNNGTVVIIAKVEDDDHYGSIEAKDSVKWGTIISITSQDEEWNKRSLSATGDKAPVYLLSAAGVIIIVVWGTILFVIFSLFRIKKAGKIRE